MAFALEQAIDEAALRLKVDPIRLRKRWDPNPEPPAALRLGGGARDMAPAHRPRGAERPLPPRRRRRRGLLALSLAARDEGRARDRGRAPRREHRDAGHRHRDAQRHRRHDCARVRARAARDRGSDRRFQPAGRTGVRRQPRHGARSSRRSSSPPASSRPASPRRPGGSPRRDRTRRGASSSPPRPISRSRPSARRTTRAPSTATIRW